MTVHKMNPNKIQNKIALRKTQRFVLTSMTSPIVAEKDTCGSITHFMWCFKVYFRTATSVIYLSNEGNDFVHSFMHNGTEKRIQISASKVTLISPRH